MSMSNIFSEEPVSQLNFNPVDPESNGTVKLCSSHQNRIIEICQFFVETYTHLVLYFSVI